MIDFNLIRKKPEPIEIRAYLFQLLDAYFDREIVLAALNSTDTKGIQYFSRYINSDLLEDPEIKKLMNKEK
jgi:hypothetical protein